MHPPADEGGTRILPVAGPRGTGLQPVAGRWQRFLATPWLPTMLGLVCFANSLPNGFVYDDRSLVLNNPGIRSLTDLRAIWLSDWWKAAEDMLDVATRRDRLFRPLTLFSFALNYALHGLHPLGYHLANVLLHALACFLVWHFARRLTDDVSVASVAAALFAVHPVHAEAVANVVGRAEVLATLGLLAGCLVLQCPNGRPGVRRTLLAALLFLAALLSKETALCYPAIALLALYAARSQRRRSWAWWLVRAGCLALPLLVYFPWRYAALEGYLFRGEPADVLMNPLAPLSVGPRLLGALTVLGHYTRLLLVPRRLSADYGVAIVDPERGWELMTLVGILVAVGLLVVLTGLVRRDGAWRLAGILGAMFLASYALISNTVLLIGVALAERLMYWPSVPALTLAAVGVVGFWRRQAAPGGPLHARARLLRVLGGLVVVALGLRTVFRNADWSSNLSLFERDVHTHPLGVHLNTCYATELLELSRMAAPHERRVLCERAWRQLDTALRVRPDSVEALVLRGKARAQLGDAAGATLDLQRALMIRPGYRKARETLDKLSRGTGEAVERLAALEAEVSAQPEDADRRVALGAALLDYGRYDEAREQLQQAVTLAPQNVEAHSRLGEALALLDKREEAINEFRRVLELAPDYWQAHVNLATLLAQRDPAQRDPTEVLKHARRGYELQPDDLRAAGNLAEAYALNGRIAEALEQYRRIERGLSAEDPYRAIVRERIQRLERSRPD